jgi:hypothetical protein
MDTSPEKEGIKLPISVVRWSVKDEPEDDPYANFSELGFSLFKDLMQTLREKYPDNNYPSDEVIDRINPQATHERYLTTYMAYDGDASVGAVIGEDSFNRLKGLWFIVSPDYRGGETARKLMESVKQDYNSVSILASSFSEDKNTSQEDFIKQQQRLVNFYKRIGFEVDNERIRHASISGMLPMVWNKK